METMVPGFLKFYLLAWLVALLVAAAIVLSKRRAFSFVAATYWRFLAEPWKLGAFVLATAAIVAAGPFSGDPTWDTPGSIVISITAFVFPPWCLGTIARAIVRRELTRALPVAILLLPVPCWAYDAYILVRDGIYPAAWWENIRISGAITVCAGLFWNIIWEKGKGVGFAFALETWPRVPRTPVSKIIVSALAIGALVVVMVAWFVWNYLWGTA